MRAARLSRTIISVLQLAGATESTGARWAETIAGSCDYESHNRCSSQPAPSSWGRRGKSCGSAENSPGGRRLLHPCTGCRRHSALPADTGESLVRPVVPGNLAEHSGKVGPWRTLPASMCVTFAREKFTASWGPSSSLSSHSPPACAWHRRNTVTPGGTVQKMLTEPPRGITAPGTAQMEGRDEEPGSRTRSQGP